MATLNRIDVFATDGEKRPNKDIQDSYFWLVEKGEEYKIVKFIINEAIGYYFPLYLCVDKNLTKEEIEKLVKEYIADISDDQVKNFNAFLKFGETYGWD